MYTRTMHILINIVILLKGKKAIDLLIDSGQKENIAMYECIFSLIMINKYYKSRKLCS